MTEVPQHAIPSRIRSVHLIAVCGTAMGALAVMLKELGYAVSGSDRNVYPPMSTYLERHAIAVMNGFDGAHLSHRPDLVVVGNAVTRDNPEAQAMREMGLAFCSLPEALNHFAAAGKETLLVAGTHGKTTTSALLAWLLYQAGLDPSFMIGGIVNDFNGNYRLGQGRFFVVEGDEYDTAYFDKGPKFLHFKPMAAAVTSVEFDHADIYRDLAHVKSAFRRFIDRMPPASLLAAYDDDANLAALLEAGCPCETVCYGHRSGSRWRLGRIAPQAPLTRFEVFQGDARFGIFETRLIGMHNLRNALAALVLAHRAGVGREALAAGMRSFSGVKRRQEVRGSKGGVTVIDDFAHHPTAVRETVAAVKTFYPGPMRLVAVFEPRTNTSMRDVFQDTYAACFDHADLICIRQPPLLAKIPAEHRFSSEKLVADLRGRGREAFYFEDTDQILAFLRGRLQPRDVVLVMSNGGFDNIHARLLDLL
jgi:UDP-N-acetylmuramate: L-alanyl-gamma-D-glutamyl-meso-diaminopimelate ligase